MKSARAGLATDSLNAMRMMLSHIPATSSASHPRRELREFFRETLSTDHVCSIVDLNQMIIEALVESHVAMKAAQKKPEGDVAASTFFSASQSGNFRPYEKLLWYVSHATCSLSFRSFACSPFRPFIGLHTSIYARQSAGDSPFMMQIRKVYLVMQTRY